MPFNSFDILEDNDIREGLKKYSNWPTYPQVYVNGQLIGGLDVIKVFVYEFYSGVMFNTAMYLRCGIFSLYYRMFERAVASRRVSWNF